MNQKQRIEELERRVRELEARPQWPVYVPVYVPAPLAPAPYQPYSPTYPTITCGQVSTTATGYLRN